MKKTIVLILISLFYVPLFAQEPALGLPGDNLNLYGVLNIFQKSPTLEEFEQNLNAKDNNVNNLDLNGDGQIDYIHVVDNANGTAHAIALRVDINASETQDVAVIEVEKDANNEVTVQIVGDEALYGKDYIVEPAQSTPNPGYTGNETQSQVNTSSNVTYVSPDSWAIIGFMFTPAYVVYVSPFHWGYYPHYWHPWRPMSYHEYYGYHSPYYTYYRRTSYYHAQEAHQYYSPRRVSSVTVSERYPSPRPGQPPQNNHGTHDIHQTQQQINAQPQPVKTNPQQHQINSQPQPVKTNPQQHQINSQPQPVKTNPQQHQINSQPAHTNPQQHQINSQPAHTNPQQHQINSQPAHTNPQQHQIQHQPGKTNSQPAKQPEKK
jgi:hypothetical protein